MTMAQSPTVFAGVVSPLDRSADDERFMCLALALAARNRGCTWPNPAVGCVIVRDEGAGPVILATGITQPGGRPHAERVALAAAGERARGATLYVCLEPCSHHGRTSPCAAAVVAAGIARVVSAVEDPDPRVAGRGHAMLHEAGIAVTVGVMAAEATRLNRGHFTRVRERRPSVTLKLARTADGFAAQHGSRLMITGEEANARVHLMRAHADAVLVGIGTVLADDPLLTVRLPGLAQRSPVRIVVDTHLRLPPASRLAATAADHATWIVCGTRRSPEREGRLAAAGLTVLPVQEGEGGRLDLRAALRALAEHGLTSVFCEGGPSLAEALMAADLVDDVALLTSPKRLAQPGLPAIGPALADALAHRFAPMADEALGADRLATFERRDN